MYEPLCFPLWFPDGGRGWSPEVQKDCRVVTQMWWYRQLLLRMEHMHLCGRLLNEWLINMYCRMEDERLQLLRRQQLSRAAVTDLRCELITNVHSRAQTPKTTYLPSRVPGSPRHMRRMRIDALEAARRKGPPSFFITLTCNPNWQEIVVALQPGQNAADRPDISVRVSHARLERMVAFLRNRFCGMWKYTLHVMECQSRGLPHAHIVLAAESAPQTPDAVDLLISCELPSEDGPLRTAVLAHMIHRCNRSCHPDDPQQECIRGSPWQFQEHTSYDIRGYPHHRRRPCGNTCPNCKANKAIYGSMKVCCNRIVVEYSPDILLMWDGHANVRFAGSVNLFEYNN